MKEYKELVITGSRQSIPEDDFSILENKEKLNFKFIGSSEIHFGHNQDDDDAENFQAYLLIADYYEDPKNIFWLSNFMKFDHKTTFISTNFDGIASDTNTSAYVIRLSDCNSFAAIYRVF